MGEPEEESLDGSSIKPVSSLRSHFEQMAKSKPRVPTPTRAISPNPPAQNTYVGDPVRPGPVRGQSVPPVGENNRDTRGRGSDVADRGLQPPQRTNSANLSPSPTRFRARPVSVVAPAVTVQPPLSPVKTRTLTPNPSNTSTYLSAGAPSLPSSRTSSPRQFKIPSRPHTPNLEPARSPSLPRSQPPSPPPPRRSGEFRRDAVSKTDLPPVNRAEKPKVASKPVSLKVEPAPMYNSQDKSSPFSTPPGSPQLEPTPPTLPDRPRTIEPVSVLSKPLALPPVQRMVISKRNDPERDDRGRRDITPQVTGDGRPPLPSRTPSRARIEMVKPHPSPQDGMLIPPPRPSVDRSRPTSAGRDAVPKRVVSGPTTRLQTPPRVHGRSMTVDLTPERVPNSGIRGPSSPVGFSEPRRASTVAPSQTKDVPSERPMEYPDSSHSNRRPPFFNQGAQEIATNYETRIYDVCGEFVCTSGHFTKVWNLLDGDIVMNLTHAEGTKIMSVAFKPASDINEEGSKLWLGNNIGEVMEVDVRTRTVIATQANAHTRREIIRIYRHKTEMWTLDDGGTLHLWASDKTGSPSLSTPYASFRVPKGHTFSMVVGDELWHATGKEVRIFVPSLNGSAQFQLLQRPLSHPNAGDVTSGTMLSTQPDRVYFGHVDGKISIYSRLDQSCLGLVNISVYKITSLAGVGGSLWAGFSTGMVYVYETTTNPWTVKKDWRAHQDPLISLVADKSSLWSLNRAQVISLGQDNMVRVWDGLLQEDWIENQMQSQEADFCDLKSIKTLVMTWNAGASTPYHLQHSEQDARFFKDLLQGSDGPDILVFGFQELVDLEDKKTTAKSFFKSKKKDSTEPEHMSHQYRDWRDFLTRCLDDYMPRDELYHLLHTSSLVGLFTCIFVRASLRERIRNVYGGEVKRGMGGLHGNKGALIVRFLLDDTSICFVNCHLAAGQTQTKDRNTDISLILESTILPAEKDMSVRQDSFIGGGDGTMIMDHEICVVNGDLNYRIDTMGRDTVVSAVKANNLTKLLERDQLLASKRKNPWFRLRAFHELPITFAPTYKYDVGTDNYDTSEKKRAPAWCDRLLYRGRDRISQLDYRRHEVRVSDHRPVSGLFQMVVKRVSPKKRAMKLEKCQRQLVELKEKLANESSLEYLTNILGFDRESSKKLILQKRTGR